MTRNQRNSMCRSLFLLVLSCWFVGDCYAHLALRVCWLFTHRRRVWNQQVGDCYTVPILLLVCWLFNHQQKYEIHWNQPGNSVVIPRFFVITMAVCLLVGYYLNCLSCCYLCLLFTYLFVGYLSVIKWLYAISLLVICCFPYVTKSIIFGWILLLAIMNNQPANQLVISTTILVLRSITIYIW